MYASNPIKCLNTTTSTPNAQIRSEECSNLIPKVEEYLLFNSSAGGFVHSLGWPSHLNPSRKWNYVYMKMSCMIHRTPETWQREMHCCDLNLFLDGFKKILIKILGIKFSDCRLNGLRNERVISFISLFFSLTCLTRWQL